MFEKPVNFVTCPKCRQAVRADDSNHAAECHGRQWKGAVEKTLEMKNRESAELVGSLPGKKAIRRAQRAIAESREKVSLSSSWGPEKKTKKVKSIISVPFESSRKKH